MIRKRLLSACLALALCLGLLPVTALAVEGAPYSLYVGNTSLSLTEDSYWTTNPDTGLLTQCTGSGDDWNVKYELSSNTLTLNKAKISGRYNEYNNPFTAGIYAKGSSDQPVALTIELIGTNTITGAYGIFLDAETNTSSHGTNATLTITGESNGSLKVSGSSSYGIYVKSGTGNASLTIENASVDATSSVSHSNYYAGVCVGSSDSATAPDLSLTVNGGSLTTSASEGNDGIQFYVGAYEATSATTSLTVTDNAIVDARTGGISASGVNGNPNVTIGSTGSTGSTGGIVFDGTEGTVYGKVELQKDLEIKSGETLTIPEGSTLTVPEDKILTNNGTIDNSGTLTNNGTVTNNGTLNVNEGGKLEGETTGGSGTVVNTPTITAQPANQTVTAGNTATFTVTATSENLTYQWSQSTDQGESWREITGATGSTYTTAATTTSMSGYQYRCEVSNSAGSVTSEVATLTVNEPAPTTYTITADVDPVEAGTVTVNGSGTSATVTAGDEVTLAATANSGYRFVGWMEGDQTVSTDTTYAFQASSNRSLTAKFEKVYTVTVNASGGGTATADKTTAAEGETVTLTATPDSGYHFTGWTSSDGVTFANASSESTTFTMPAGDVTVTAGFTRISSGSTTPTKTPSQQAVDKIESAKEGSTVEITLRTGQTKLDKEVFEALAGRDVTLEISLPGGVSWTVNGQDIPENIDLTDLDLDVTLDASTIPVSVINTVTGAVDTIQLSLKHDGEFGFTMTLSAPLGRDNADYWANLYWYNERTEELEFQQAARIARDGTAEFDLDHASDYAIVIDDRSHEPVDLPFNDVPESYWAYDAIQYVYGEGLMAGTSGSTFSPEGTTTRGQIVTILWRLSGSPVVNYLMDFDDVDPAAYYAEAIRWAVSEGIAGGYGGGVFGPDDPITREQLAAILYRYAQAKGYDTSVGEDTNILSYTDALEISEYAIPAMQWACGAGILEGDAGHLYPQGNATRAQIATMLMRFCENYVTW